MFNEDHYNLTYNKWTIPIPAAIDGGFLRTDVETSFVVEYTGYMTDEMRGFYRSYYMENGKKVWMASTQFQPSDARRAFPCFDVRNFSLIYN